MNIIGIDPGSRVTGYGIIKVALNKIHYIDSGCIKTTTPDIPNRLKEISAGLTEIVQRHPLEQAAVEEVFMHRNADSALKLGHARGAAIVTLVNHDLLVSEYSARQIKKNIVGIGSAEKSQVQHMVQTILNIRESLESDEADALAVALCHAHTLQGMIKLSGAARYSRGRIK